MPGISAVANVFNEVNAISGWLESVSIWADDVVVYHTGPQGKYSNDGTIEILEKWGVRIEYGSIDEGFGVVRSKLIRMGNEEWTMILDSDERFHPIVPSLTCETDSSITPTYNSMYKSDVGLVVTKGECYDQERLLREQLNRTDIDAICCARRHWFNLHWDKPTQNWMEIPDYQLRIVRNCDHIYYKTEPKMHEQIWDDRINAEPRHVKPDWNYGPFFDHYHCFFKPMELEQRKHDVEIYNALHEGRTPPTE
jgi:glycosyltransferase involved in cell wall biosynthesis